MIKREYLNTFISSLFVLMILSLLVLLTGPISIEVSDLVNGQMDQMSKNVLMRIRFPRLLMAIFAGGGLAACGLVLQTWFKNQLADPYLLGVHSGSSLGVAVFVLGVHTFFNQYEFIQSLGPATFGIFGAFFVLGLMMVVGAKFRGSIYIIIFGVVISFFITGLINLLLSFSSSNELRQFFLWSLGSFDRVTLLEAIFVSFSILLALSFLTINANTLNICLLGESYAQESGVDLRLLRKIVIPAVGVVSGLVSVYCGPIIFIGLMAPHMTRMIYFTSNHRILIPASFVVGAILSLVVTLASNGYFFSVSIPINALLGLVGTPFVLSLLIRANNKSQGASYV